MLSKSHDRIALAFLVTGLVLGGWIMNEGMVLAAVVSALGSIMGSMALLSFGGEVSED